MALRNNWTDTQAIPVISMSLQLEFSIVLGVRLCRGASHGQDAITDLIPAHSLDVTESTPCFHRVVRDDDRNDLG